MSPMCNMGVQDQPHRWNSGYHFSRCERCGRDFIRTIYGRWQAAIRALTGGGVEAGAPTHDVRAGRAGFSG